MVGLGMKENFIWICSFGFSSCLPLPFANTATDYLVRININKADQGKVWGPSGLFLNWAMYSLCRHGWVADTLFKPSLTYFGWLANSVGKNHRCWRRQRLRSALYPIRYLYQHRCLPLLSRARSVKELEYVSTLDKNDLKENKVSMLVIGLFLLLTLTLSLQPRA